MSLGFKNNEVEKNQDFIIPVDFTNAICYGQTGSGKTTAFMLPNIKERMKAGHKLIIYAYKGNLNAQIKAIAEDCGRLKDIVEIGTPWGERINLLASLKEKDIKQWYLVHSSSENKYWENSSWGLFSSVHKSLEVLHSLAKSCDNFSLASRELAQYELCKELENFKPAPTFKSIFDMLNQKKLADLAKLLLGFQNILSEISGNGTDDFLNELNALNGLCLYFETFNEGLKGCDGGHGNKGVLEMLLNSISNIAQASSLNSNDDISTILGSKAILIVHTEAISCDGASLLNQAISKALISRLGKDDNMEDTTIFIDEAHKVISGGNMPETSVCRESRFEYIMSVQSPDILIEALGKQRVFDSMEVNIAHRLSFYSPNMPETSKLRKFEMEFLSGSKNSGQKVINSEPIFFSNDELEAIQKLYCKELGILNNIIISIFDKDDISYIIPCDSEEYGIFVYKNTGARKTAKVIKKSLKQEILGCAKNISQEKENLKKTKKGKENYELFKLITSILESPYQTYEEYEMAMIAKENQELWDYPYNSVDYQEEHFQRLLEKNYLKEQLQSLYFEEIVEEYQYDFDEDYDVCEEEISAVEYFAGGFDEEALKEVEEFDELLYNVALEKPNEQEAKKS